MSKAILWIDDDPTMLELGRVILEGDGYEVQTAAEGNAAILLVIEGFRPDLLLIDARLPGMSGEDLRRVLMQMLPGIKTAFVTGLAEPLGNGAAALYKPFTTGSLLQLVHNQIGLARDASKP